MYEILRLLEEVDGVVGKMDSQIGFVFGKISLKIPKMRPAELGFLHAVSWTYALYIEVGRIGVDFLQERLGAYGIDEGSKYQTHVELVIKLRTYTQHSIDPGKQHDDEIRKTCEDWFRESCGSPYPGEAIHWQKCLISLLTEVIGFLSALKKCLRAIEADDSRESFLLQWKLRRTRYHPAHEFDDLIVIVARDMGREALDVVRFRLKFYDGWKKDLDLLQGEYDFSLEARKLIEHALLSDTTPTLPITGLDIMQELGQAPGPKIGALLKKAREIYEAQPCNKGELIAKLKEYLVNTF